MRRFVVTALVMGAMFLFGAAATTRADLDNACALTATEAYARIHSSSAWCEVLAIQFQSLITGAKSGHALTVWQITPNGPVLVYDHKGTIILKTHSRELKDIVAELNEITAPFEVIFSAAFIE